MGVLLKVLGRAGPSVMIFTIVAMVPCIGLSLSYHVTFGAVVKNYSSPYLALNSVMRMAGVCLFHAFDTDAIATV
jgi:amino acid permease